MQIGLACAFEGSRTGPQTGSTVSKQIYYLANGRLNVSPKYQMPFGNDPTVKWSHFAAPVPVYSPFQLKTV